jgi:flagellar biosynthesis protein FlhF
MRDMLQVMYSENPGAGLPTEFAHHYRHLVNLGVSRRVAAQLVAAVLRTADLDALRTGRLFEERLKLEIRRRVRVTGGIATEAGSCRVVALCGPTGVGKTTTLAKLAARFAIRERARVAAITADTYRIAAPEQLRVYANIVGVPLAVVNDAEEMRRALDQYRQYDLVFVDTAGSSQFNLEQINELKGVLEAARPYETLLALAANTQIADLRNVVSNFKCLNPTSVIFTKVDETRQYGSLLTVLAEAGLPLSYLSTGQNVPGDIRVAASATVANLIMEGRDNRG